MKLLFAWLSLIILSWSYTILAAEHNGPSIYTEQNTSITITRKQPQFIIKLRSNPTTGFSWSLKRYDPQLIQPMNHYFQSRHHPQLIGAPGYELWTFKATAKTFTASLQTPIVLIYARPWEKVKPIATIIFWVSVAHV